MWSSITLDYDNNVNKSKNPNFSTVRIFHFQLPPNKKDELFTAHPWVLWVGGVPHEAQTESELINRIIQNLVFVFIFF